MKSVANGRGRGVQLTKRMAGASNCAEVLEQLGVHGRRAVDESRDHQPIARIEEDDLGVDARGGGGSSRHLLVDAVDVLARALTRDAQHVPIIADGDEMIDVGEPRKPLVVRSVAPANIGTLASADSRSLIGASCHALDDLPR